MSMGGWVCISLRLCVSVCGSAAAQTDEWILMKFSTNDLTDICKVLFLVFEFSKSMTSWRPFGIFVAPIFFKVAEEVESCLPLFAI